MIFAVLPPEINSALMYSGAGSGPLLGAAAAWESLSNELGSAAAGFSSVIDTLGGSWAGISADAAIASASTYVEWMTQAAASAQVSAEQALAAVGAYQIAYAATVAPSVVAANRSQLATLIATNFMGVNTAAIALTEAEYAEMWAQDVAAMFAYQAQSAAATSALPNFTPPASATTGVIPTASVVSAGNAQSVLASTTGASLGSWLTSPNDFLAALANPATPVGFLEAQWLALQSSGVYQVLSYPLMASLMGQANGLMQQSNDITLWEHNGGMGNSAYGGSGSVGALGASTVSASLGEAGKAGTLSVPGSWPSEKTSLASAGTPLIEDGPGGPGGVPMVSVPGGKEGLRYQRPRYGTVPKVVSAWPWGG